MKDRLFKLGDLLHLKDATFPALKRMKSQISDEMIPLGFIYTQLPFQSSPNLLWPWAKWTDITVDYSGHFFRAAGNGSEPFGVPQDDAIRQYQYASEHLSSKFLYSDSEESSYDTIGPNSYPFSNPRTGNIKSVSDTETRPKNFAVKIWIRKS